jgi:hypothetical protein
MNRQKASLRYSVLRQPVEDIEGGMEQNFQQRGAGYRRLYLGMQVENKFVTVRCITLPTDISTIP